MKRQVQVLTVSFQVKTRKSTAQDFSSPAMDNMNTPSKKLSAVRYRDQSKHLSRIFDLIRHSLKELGNKGFRRFIENARDPEISACEKAHGLLSKMSLDPAGIDIDDIKRRKLKKISEDLPLTPTLKWAEYKGHALLGLNSSELIIRVALFEAILKDIHRQTLLANQKLLSLCKPNRPIPLKDIFRAGFERFKFTEIDRQVREADRLKTSEKARFFQRRLKLPWNNDPEVERDLVKRIDQLIRLRHELVHCDYGTHVRDKDVSDARQLFLRVPETCVFTAAKIYHTHFALA
jgi:hypothetical protein